MMLTTPSPKMSPRASQNVSQDSLKAPVYLVFRGFFVSVRPVTVLAIPGFPRKRVGTLDRSGGPRRRFHQAAGDARRLLTEVKGQLAVAQRHVGGGDAVKAPHVIGPGLVDDDLDKTAGVVDVVQQLPRQGPVAQTAAAPLDQHQ